jgi:large subunit ribosomal protein L21
MYAIFETGGKQYKVAAGDVLKVEKLPEGVGEKIKFDKVLAVNDGKETHVGTPYLDAATVDAEVTAVGKGEKIIIFKFKAKKDYRRKRGHRQPFTEIVIESVTLGGNTVMKNEAPKKAPKKKDEPADENKDEKPETAADEPEAKEAAEAAEAVETPDAPETPDAEKAEEADEAVEAAEAKPEDADAAAEQAEGDDSASSASKLTKADIMAKLDELGAEYAKSAKKDELLAILAEAENK